MDTFGDERSCRICFKKHDTMYSLFHKRNSISLSEKLSKVGIKADENDAGPACICSDCLAELDITVSFLEKCEKSKQILDKYLSSTFEYPEEIASSKEDNNLNIDHENKAAYSGAGHVDIVQEASVDSVSEQVKSSDILSFKERKCDKCGAKRRCSHWAPPDTHTCPYCQKVIKRKFNFKLHLKRHSGSREWWCVVCGAGAVSRSLAERHCAPRRRRACPAPGCHKTYTTNTNLNAHLRMQHTGERPFGCSQCDKKFTSKNILRDHIRIHTGALPYICPVCGKRFRTNKLSAHMLTHPRGGVAGAAGCEARFSSRRALPRPARAPHPPGAGAATPPAPAPYACSLCSARYHHKQSLNKHIKKQHSQEPLSTEMESNGIAKEIESNLSKC